MQKGKSAEDIADLILERRTYAEKRAYESLKSKCTEAINKMGLDLKYETTVELTEDDLLALVPITEEMRELNYKFRFIQVENSNGDVVKHKLTISISHVK